MFSELDEVALCGSLRQLAGRLCLSRAPCSLIGSVDVGSSLYCSPPPFLVGWRGGLLSGWLREIGSSRYIVHLLPFWWVEGLDFRVKGGLVTELLVRVCLKSGLGSFVGSSTFIFSPSPLGSA